MKFNRDELKGLGFYPLEDKYSKQRANLKNHMEYHAIKWAEHFRTQRSRKKYDYSKFEFGGDGSKLINEFKKYIIL